MPKFSLSETTTSEVLEMIKNMKNSHAFGRDLIDSTTVKLGAEVLAPVFKHLINLSINSSKFPQKWKLARVFPLQKASDCDITSPSSFRPISQLPLISKMTERVIQKQLLSYLENSGQLHVNQHAYRNKTSTTTALIQMMNQIATATDHNLTTTTMGIDQTAAFDCVDPRILLDKLSFYGLDHGAISWIESYLSGRSFYVVIGSTSSKIHFTHYGVPQGSVLGPLLYLCYINEFPAAMEDNFCVDPIHRDDRVLFGGKCDDCGTLTVFADDSLYVYSSNNRTLNQEKINNYFFQN